jgi:hypothetical protein
VPERSAYDYAVVRVVPDLDRAEFINVGVILFAKTARALLTRVSLDPASLARLAPAADAALVRSHLDSLERIAAGDEDAGPIARLSPSQRFHWLVSPRSTMIQTSPVHSGLCDEPQAELDRLFERLVSPAGREAGVGGSR